MTFCFLALNLLPCSKERLEDVLLRITKTENGPLPVTLKLEGRIVSDWVGVLEEECVMSLREKQEVILDFSGVTFIDRQGVKMLKKIATEYLHIVNCCPFVEALLQEGGKR